VPLAQNNVFRDIGRRFAKDNTEFLYDGWPCELLICIIESGYPFGPELNFGTRLVVANAFRVG